MENDFSDEEGFKYFLAYSITGVVATSASATSHNFVAFAGLLAGVLITIWGCLSIFKANSTGDGKNFYKRYFALSWVIGFRLLIYILIIGIPLVIIYGIMSPESFNTVDSDSTTLSADFATMLISSLVMLIYYLLLTSSFNRVSTQVNK
jgi:hypothetical protein